jgi:hypothetical protein
MTSIRFNTTPNSDLLIYCCLHFSSFFIHITDEVILPSLLFTIISLVNIIMDLVGYLNKIYYNIFTVLTILIQVF